MKTHLNITRTGQQEWDCAINDEVGFSITEGLDAYEVVEFNNNELVDRLELSDWGEIIEYLEEVDRQTSNH